MRPRINTPIEEYEVNGVPVFVKREDESVPPPAPPFSKVRGLYSHLESLAERGVNTVGYTETSVSMAGWGVAWAAKELRMKAVIFDPQYKTSQPLLELHRKKWKEFKPDLIPIKAGMARVNYNISRRILRERYGEGAVMLELGLPLEESVAETAKEWRRTMKEVSPHITVVNIGSGTIAAGIIRGWKPGDGRIVGVMGRTGEAKRKMDRISSKAHRPIGGMTGAPLVLVDPGWEYTERSKVSCPFPCHPYYDLKAWEWLKENLKKGMLFWNIGRTV